MLRSAVLPAASLAALLAWSTVASAGNRLTVTAPVSLGGEQLFTEVIVKAGGALNVPPLTVDGTGVASGGSLHLKADRIVIEAGGLVQANVAGHRGVDDGDGEGEGATGGGKKGLGLGEPGGGGAYGGDGGSGVRADCSLFAGSPGGTAYPTLLTFGSAGGAANVSAGATGSRGGRGGGTIVLEAAVLEIYGAIEAKGGDGVVTQSVGSGGGAGGAVELIAATFLTDAATAQVVVTGGRGGAGTAGVGAYGGGGAGGRVVLRIAASALAPDVTGGPGGPDCAGGEGDGADGQIDLMGAPAACPDLDGDGALSALCAGGTDCDDGDGELRPGAPELCDGLDNDCSGTADDALVASACAAPLVCQAGVCAEAPDAGVDAGPGDGAVPAGIKLGGGCNVPGGRAPVGGAALALAALGLAAARLARSRSR